MAISAPGSFYEINRDMHYRNEQERYEYEKEMFRRRQQEEECRRMQYAYYNPAQQQEKLANTAPKPDLNDPLGFLSKTDTKILLTGEAS